jgi:hypothetical protein
MPTGSPRAHASLLAVLTLVALAGAVAGTTAAARWLADHGQPRAFAPATPAPDGCPASIADQQMAQLLPDAMPGYAGPGSWRASTMGGLGNAFARGVCEVDWRDGEDIAYGAAFFLPEGFHDQLDGQVDLLRWDDFPDEPVHTVRSGVVVFVGDRRAHLVRQRLGTEQRPLAAPFALPEGRWFWLEVRQRLGAGDGAHSEVRIDGRTVAESDEPTTYGGRVLRVRHGIVAVDANRQGRPLTLWVDRPWTGHRVLGPVAG